MRTTCRNRVRVGVLAAIAMTLAGATAGCSGFEKEFTERLREYSGRIVVLEWLDLGAVRQDWGTARAGQSVDKHPLTLAGKGLDAGVGTHAYSEWIIDLHGDAEEFHATVGVDDESKKLGSVVFVVLVDGREAARTGVLRGGDPPEDMAVDLRGASRMELIVDDAGDGIDHDHADWGNAYILMTPDAAQRMASDPAFRPQSVPFPDPMPDIIRPTPDEPAIHAPRITGATPGRPFLFRIPATGRPPLRFAAENLPEGLVLDAETGIITGSIAFDGPTMTGVRLTVEGPAGRTESTLMIAGGQRVLAMTPPMGWNSWNVWGTAVDDAKVRAAADWMVRSGLAAHGYQYVNVDDAWEGERDESGRIQSNGKFPDMKALADYVHGLGLKLGIYSSPGPKTCADYEGSYGHELQDAQTYAEWGIDLIKYDWCSYGDIAADKSEPELRRPYEVMRAALDQCGRDIVYSLCQYGMGEVWRWGREVGGNYWRTTGDIVDTWASMSGIGFGQDGKEPYAGPGRWNDPDMLVVGQVGWGPDLRRTRLTHYEQQTHITLWSLLAAPLLTGCDLSQLDEFTLALLTNPEVLEVNQDPLGRQARRVAVDGHAEVWARPLADGTQAVGLFNRGREPATVTAHWSDLGLTGPQPIRDLWSRSDTGVFDGSYSAEVPRHGCVLIRVGLSTAETRTSVDSR